MKTQVNRIKLSGGDRVFVLINSALLVLIFVLVLYPIWFVVIASFSDPEMVNTGRVILFPRGWTVGGYARVLRYGEIWTGYGNTIFYTVLGTLLNLAATLPCAYALSRRDMVGRNVLMTLFIITMYFGGGLIPSYLNVKSLGLLNTRLYMLIGGLVSAYNIIVSRTFFANTIPWEMHEAARIDGASDACMFLKIILPLSKPIIAVMALYYGVGHWNSYFNAMIYLKDRALYPLQLFLREILVQSKLATLVAEEGADEATLKYIEEQQMIANLLKYCVIVISTAPMMVIYPWMQRFFAKGVMIGSVKG